MRTFSATICFLLVVLLHTLSGDAQRPRFSDSYVVPNGQVASPVIGAHPVGTQQVVAPPLQAAPQLGAPVVTPQGQPAFDPFAAQVPSLTSPPTQSIPTPPSIYTQTTPAPGFGYSHLDPYPIPPPSVSNGSWGESVTTWPTQTWARLRGSDVYRLLERPRFRHTYLGGNNSGRNLGLNESEIATTLTIPNFLYMAQPLRISPGFIFHWWNGPNTLATGADLPSRTYSTYFAFDYSTPWDKQVGGEVNFTMGVYSDFEFTNSDSVRFTGVGLGWVRLNNATTFKFGIEYLDRVDVKLLPAVGFFVYPSPDWKLDIYFPRPKIARRLPSLSNHQVWGYLGGEYGGGSWTVERTSGLGDQVDMNDLRVLVGLEWLGPRCVTGFFEAGYVFNRQLVYRSAPAVGFDFNDTYMLRAGIAF